MKNFFFGGGGRVIREQTMAVERYFWLLICCCNELQNWVDHISSKTNTVRCQQQQPLRPPVTWIHNTLITKIITPSPLQLKKRKNRSDAGGIDRVTRARSRNETLICFLFLFFLFFLSLTIRPVELAAARERRNHGRERNGGQYVANVRQV